MVLFPIFMKKSAALFHTNLTETAYQTLPLCIQLVISLDIVITQSLKCGRKYSTKSSHYGPEA